MGEQRVAGGQPGPTLQGPALVHAAWLQLVGSDGRGHFANRAHFFGAAAQAMRRILIDRARRKGAQKRGGGVEPIDLDSVEVAATAGAGTLLRIDEALEQLALEAPASAQLARLPFFFRLTT